MTPLETILLVVVGCAAIGWLCWWYVKKQLPFEPGSLREPLDGWPRRNAGGGYDWPDGSITRDPEGRDVIRRRSDA